MARSHSSPFSLAPLGLPAAGRGSPERQAAASTRISIRGASSSVRDVPIAACMGEWVHRRRAVVATLIVSGLLAACTSGADGATVVGSDVARTDQLTGGDFVVWRDGARPWIDCSRQLRIPAAQTVLDLRQMRTHDLPASAADGTIEVSHLDREGRAIGRRFTCDGMIAYGSVDLTTGAFADYATLAEAQPLPQLAPACPGCGPAGVPATYGFDFHDLVHGEAIDLRVLASDSVWGARRFLVRRIDMTTGRTRSREFDRSVFDDLDDVARARNGDLVWASHNGHVGGTRRDPCTLRPDVRRWSYATGTLTTTHPRLGGYLPARAVARSISTCWGELDPDTGRLYRPFRRADHVTWQLRCGALDGLRLRACAATTAVSGGGARCCIRIHDTTTNVVRVVAPLRSGPWQRPVAITPRVVAWETTSEYHGDRVVGPLRYELIDRLTPAVTVTSVRSQAGGLTVAWRTYATRYRTTIVLQTGTTAWGQPDFAHLTGLRRLGTGTCTPPYDFRRTAPPGYATCKPRLGTGPAQIRFRDRPGRQRYFVNAGGFMSQPIVR